MLDGTSHGFFGRAGGVSTGDYESLNCGPGSCDPSANVTENRARAAAALGGLPLTTLYQTHSAIAVYTEQPFETPPEADGLVTASSDILIGILTADCLPVLFHDPAAGLVGAAHAGWRGALGGILEATIALMEQHGSRPKNIRTVMGPALRHQNFECRDDMRSLFTDKFPPASRFFTEDPVPGTWHFDPVDFCRWRLEETGLDPAHIASLDHCTLGAANRWFSYRHSRQTGAADYGRNLSAISLSR